MKRRSRSAGSRWAAIAASPRSMCRRTVAAHWYRTTLGADEGRYSFRRWDGRVPLRRGPNPIMVRCWNTNGVAQPMKPIWNPGGFMRGNIETTTIIAA